MSELRWIMHTLVCEGLGAFIVGLTSVPWLRRCFLVGEILFNLRILRSSFFIGLSWLGLSVVRKVFPYRIMSVGQMRSCQTRYRFYCSLQLPFVGFLSLFTHSSHHFEVFDSPKDDIVGLKVGLPTLSCRYLG